MRVTISGSGAILTHGDSLSGGGVIEFPVNEPSAFDDTLAAYTVTGSAPSRKLRFQGHEIAVETATSTAERAPVTAGGAGTLEDPGNVWAPDTAVAEGDRIAESVQGAVRVFEVTVGGTTGSAAFTDYSIVLTPLGTFATGAVTWRYLGIVGELPWDIVPQEQSFGEDANGPYIAARHPIDDPDTALNIYAALPDPGNTWQATTLVDTPVYRIAATVSGALRVFELAGFGTTGGSEPTWVIERVGLTTSDGSATWTYRGVVGDPDTDRPVFTANTAGDADWFLDVNNGSGFRFNIADDGVGVAGSGATQITPDGFQVAVGAAQFFVQYDPFAIIVLSLPTSDPGVGHVGELFTDGVPSAGVPKALMVSGG